MFVIELLCVDLKVDCVYVIDTVIVLCTIGSSLCLCVVSM